MNFVFLMMDREKILSVDVVDIATTEETIEQAAAALAKEITEQTGRAPTGYAVLGDTAAEVWLLQQVREVPQ